LVTRCKNALEAYDFLQRETVDLIFLDIHMPELTGIDFLKSLPSRPEVIFTTAYPNYALEGFNLDVLDYLLKPIAFDRFLKAVSKASKIVHLQESDSSNSNTTASSSSESTSDTSDNYFFVKSDQKMVKIRYHEILYIEGMKDYVQIHTTDQRIITHSTMKKMDESLPRKRFMRVHRSFIVAINKIESVDGNILEIGKGNDKQRISVGANYKDELVKLIQDHKN
jgi:DNA-binding LytR/AlgR family response regulator